MPIFFFILYILMCLILRFDGLRFHSFAFCVSLPFSQVPISTFHFFVLSVCSSHLRACHVGAVLCPDAPRGWWCTDRGCNMSDTVRGDHMDNVHCSILSKHLQTSAWLKSIRLPPKLSVSFFPPWLWSSDLDGMGFHVLVICYARTFGWDGLHFGPKEETSCYL